MKRRKFRIKSAMYKCLRSRLTWSIVALLILVPLNGCDTNIAVITFHQIGVCGQYTDQIGTFHAVAPPAFYAKFEIDSVDNTGSKLEFDFDPSKLTAKGGVQEQAVDMYLTTNIAGPFAAVAGPQPVPSGTSSKPGVYVVALVTALPNSSSPPLFSLNYPAFQKGAPVVNVISQNPNQPSAGKQVDDCKSLY